MFKKLGNTFYMLTCAVLIIQLMGCGTIMYPERKGQKSGKIDAGVAVLDGVGLLFFLIPGIIAYAIDFNNGTIYLPGTSRSSLEIKNLKMVKFDPQASSMASIERMIQQETGADVSLYEKSTTVLKLKSSEDMLAHFAKALPEIQNARIVLLNK